MTIPPALAALVALVEGGVGLLQLSVLPGMLVLILLQRRGCAPAGPSAILFVFVCSVTLTYALTLLLHTAGLHNRTLWWLLALLQTAAWACLARSSALPAATPGTSAPIPLLHAAGAGTYLLYCLLFAFALASRWPAAFEEWDAVINWNRWALDWTRGTWPVLNWGYPQLLPASWSLIYLWQGSVETEFLVRAWLGLFPLALALLFFDMFLRWRALAPLVAGAAFLLLLDGPFAQVRDSGYADVPVAFFTLLTGHWVLCACAERDRPAPWPALAALACAAAVLTKQGGVLALPVLGWALWCCRRQTQAWLAALAVLVALVLPWYGLLWLNGTGGDVTGYVTSTIYGNETLPARLWRALTSTLPALLFAGSSPVTGGILLSLSAATLVCSLREARGRFCAGFGTLWLLVWALFFSYDGRNLLPGLGFLLLAAAIGAETLLMHLCARLPTIALHALPRWRLPAQTGPALLLVLLGASLLPGDPLRWEQLTNDLRKQSGDPVLNRQLLEYVSAPQFTGQIYTTYPQLAAIAELRPHLFADFGATHMQPQTTGALLAGAPFCDILATFPRHTSISHLLLHRSVYPELVDTALAEGSLVLRLETAQQRLMQVNCPPATATPGEGIQ